MGCIPKLGVVVRGRGVGWVAGEGASAWGMQCNVLFLARLSEAFLVKAVLQA